MSPNHFIPALLSLVFVSLCYADDFKVADAPKSITSIMSSDIIKLGAQIIGDSADYVRGEDHTLLDKVNNRLIVFGMNHRIFSIDLTTGKTYLLAQTPVMPGGAQFDPQDPSKILFCGTKEEGRPYPAGIKTGVYQLDMSVYPAQVKLLLGKVFVDRVPKGNDGIAYSIDRSPRMTLSSLSETNPQARDFGICDDVAVSADGQRIYIAEPYSTAGGGFGDEKSAKVNQREILMASQNGKLWMFDRKNEVVHLMGTRFAFVDGIAIENLNPNQQEESILVTELARYKLHRFNLKDGGFETLFENMPGMPNSMAIDENGYVYMALNKMRTGLFNFLINSNSLIKEIILAVPSSLKPIPKETGFLIFKPVGKKLVPAYYTVHDGSKMMSVISLTPNLATQEIYLSIFDPSYKGVYKIPMPKLF
ncbi:MAG: hypothetical protein H7235_02400 [Bdellovibrionaceae bacterium]|nr:hypothetical protein [Pseudobdellovibrionaceae bacterium]